MDEKKKHYLYIAGGYIGIFLIVIAGLRYIIIANDPYGQGLISFGLILIMITFKFMESKFLTVKERRIVDGVFYGIMAIIFIIGFTFVL